MIEIAFVKIGGPPGGPKGTVVLPLMEGAAPPAAFGPDLARALEAASFKGKKGSAVALYAPPVPGVAKIVAVGLGAPDALDPRAAEAAGGNAVPHLAADREATVWAEGMTAALAASLAMGALLRSWRFDRYRTTLKEDDRPKLAKLAVATAEATAARAAFAPMRAVADGVFLARELATEPPNVLTPAELAERCRPLEKLGVQVEVLGPKDLRKLGFGAMLGVAQGSANEARMVVMRWNGLPAQPRRKPGADRPLCFVGKGVTFDTGGISIKAAAGMEDMKWDMAGAAAVIGAMAALAGRKARADVVGLVGLVENMPSGTAQRPGDVVRTASGQTVEVINTDAEGRLVLADVFHYAIERFEPAFLVDLATLTGAVIVALGHEHAGLFSNDDGLAARLVAAGEAVGEPCWRMPLGEAYDRALKSDIADMKNVGGRPGGSITAAQFLQRFVRGKPWAHLDIAGTAWSAKETATAPKGATAYGVRLLDRLVAEHHEGAG